MPAYQDAYVLAPVLLHPQSQGEVSLRSVNPFAPVRIKGNFLAEPEDVKTLREAVHRARDVGGRVPLNSFRGREASPGPEVNMDSEIDAWIRNTVVTVNHPQGTCAMGQGPGAVLAPDLKVLGVEKLRVVDASALPDMPSAHINVSVMTLAERASDLIPWTYPVAIGKCLNLGAPENSRCERASGTEPGLNPRQVDISDSPHKRTLKERRQ